MNIETGPILRLVEEILNRDPVLRDEVIADVVEATGVSRSEVEKMLEDARVEKSDRQTENR